MKRSTGPCGGEASALLARKRRWRLRAADRAGRWGALTQLPRARAHPPTPGSGESHFGTGRTEAKTKKLRGPEVYQLRPNDTSPSGMGEAADVGWAAQRNPALDVGGDMMWHGDSEGGPR
jgi:hypothetical protein